MTLAIDKQLKVLAELAQGPATAVPDVLRLVERRLGVSGSLLLWGSADGQVAGGYSTVVGMEAGLRYYAEQFSNSSAEEEFGGTRFEDAMAGQFKAEVFSQIARMSPREFRECDVHRQMLAPYGIDDGARVVVHHRGRPLGGLVVFRGADEPAFRRTELRQLERLAPLVGDVLVSRADAELPFAPVGGLGVALIDTDSSIISTSAEFRRYLSMLNQHAPGESAASFDVALPTEVQEFAESSRAGDAFLEIDNAWGRFHLYHQAMYDSRLRTLAVKRLVPVGLRMFQRIHDHDLSKRQLQAACGVAEGHSFAELAEKWGISRHSVVTHIKQAYLKLGVQRTSEMLDRYVWTSLSPSQ